MKLKEKLKNMATMLKSDIAALFLAFKRKDTPILSKFIIGSAGYYHMAYSDCLCRK